MNNPFLEISFDIHWSLLMTDYVKSGIETALMEAQNSIDEICVQDKDRITFQSSFLALEEATEQLNVAWGIVNHLDAVCNSPELRKVYNELLPEVSEFYARISLNAELWSVLKIYAQTNDARNSRGVKKRFINETMAEFREHGADLPLDKKQSLEKLEKELAQVTQKYSENVLDSTNDYELILDDEALLEGLPPTAKEAAHQSALNKGIGSEEQPKWRFTLHTPSFLPSMKYLESDRIRKKLWESSAAIGHTEPFDNSELIWKSLALREEKAKLLVKENFADLILERRMARNGATALGFIDDLHGRIKETFDKECEELELFKAEKTGSSKEPIEPWDLLYWSEKLRKERYDFNEEELRPYFPIDRVIKGMFTLFESIFELKIKECPALYPNSKNKNERPKPDTYSPWMKPVEVWHPEVKYYEVYNHDDRHLGSFYADWHPRESKRSGAWMDYLITGDINHAKNKRDPHLGLICGNLTSSVGDKPALLTHDEVSTIFHEFGHLLHHILGEAEIKSMNGVNVAWDFVELPSQIMVNWCWERQSLDLFARHYKTGKTIPDKLYNKMIRARNFQSARIMMRQLSFAKMDLELHMHFPQFAERDLDSILEEMLALYHAPSKTKPPTIIRRFTHLFASSVGYASGYYSYKWAEVLDADAFTRFKTEGVLSPCVGREFKEKILNKGNLEDPSKLFKDFMGRDPDLKALLIRDGLAR